jgi:glyoxylase-like metal-dependent hydrolase (beta-lactamase superfamily II)
MKTYSLVWKFAAGVFGFGLANPAFAGDGRSPAAWDAVLDRAREVSRTIPGDLPESIHYLAFASVMTPLSGIVQGGSDEQIEGVYTVFQVRYPRGWLMVDAGMDADIDPDVSIQSQPHEQIQRALLGANLIFVTHEHHDHVAGVVRPPLMSQVAAKTLLTKPQVKTLLERPSLPIVKLTKEQAAAYLVIDYDTLFPAAPGVVLIAAPGHTPGSQLIYVRLASGKEALLIGDVVWNMAALTGPRQKPEAISKMLEEDRPALQGQMEWLGALRDRNKIALIPCHDKDWLKGLEGEGILRAGLDLSSTGASSSAELLLQNLAKWRNQGIKDYEFKLHFTGHVPQVGPLPAARVIVGNDAVVDAKLLAPLKKLRTGSHAPRDPYLRGYFYLSVSDLFEEAADSIQYGRGHPAATVSIDYDAQYGFPVKIEVSDPQTSDAEGAYVVTEFRERQMRRE